MFKTLLSEGILEGGEGNELHGMDPLVSKDVGMLMASFMKKKKRPVSLPLFYTMAPLYYPASK